MLPRISVVECNEARYMLFSTKDYISNELFLTGKWEEHLLDISKAFVSGLDAPIVLDIGANLGAYSIPLAKSIQAAGGKVYGFEPQRIVYYQLCGNVVLNRLQNYYAYNCAVGDVLGDIEVPDIDYESNRNIGAFSLEKKYREEHGIERSLKTTTNTVFVTMLDEFQVEKAPALIKIDVEGFELNVLKGAVNFLKQHQFPPILFEAWDLDWFQKDREELINFVLSLGYNLVKLGASDYVAQHPDNSVFVDLTQAEDGGLNIVRVR